MVENEFKEDFDPVEEHEIQQLFNESRIDLPEPTAKQTEETVLKARHQAGLTDYLTLLVRTGRVTLYLLDHESKEANSEGFKATLLVTGAQRVGPVDIAPAGGNKMEAAVASLPAGGTAVVTLTDKAGKSAQGRYKLP